MTINIGDATTRSITFENESGTPTNPTTVTATLYLPDDTTTTPSITSGSTGVRSVTVTPTMAGTHRLKWVGTGAVTVTEWDVFEVVTDPTAPLLDIVTLGEAKEAIKGFSGTAYDAELQRWVTAVSERVDELYGPVVARPTTERLNGRSAILQLRYPVLSVTSVTEYAGTTGTTLVAENFPGGVTANDYYLDTSRWRLTRRSSGADSTFGAPVVVVYEAGRYADTASVGQRWKTAVLDVLRRRWARESPAWARSSQFPDAVEPAGPLFFNATDSALRELLGSPPFGFA